MKLTTSFELVNIAGEYLAVPVGEKASTFKGVVALSEAAFYLLGHIRGDVNKKQLVELLTNNYDIDNETATKDVELFTNKMMETGILE